MKVLMVCLGNICRSPLAQGILEHKCNAYGLNWQIDSAGTSAYHVGQAPDHRSIDIAKQNGIDITRQHARQVKQKDLDQYDLILAMDQSNLKNLEKLSSKTNHEKIKLILSFGSGDKIDVPDPYYVNGFDRVYDMIEDACEGLIEHYKVLS